MNGPSPRIVLRALVAGVLVACLVPLGGCSGARLDADDALIVFAASDLQPVLPAIAERFREQGGRPLRLVFGSSGNLATQIAHGAPADVYLGASAALADGLVEDGSALQESRTAYAVGRLALVVRPGLPPPGELADLQAARYAVVSIANPEHAPYGIAARQALASAALLASVERRLVMADNVMHAYHLVETGSADAGLVALSLVRAREGVTALLVDGRLHDPILQVGAVVTASRDPEGAGAFLRFLLRVEAQEILARYGFESPGSS
jgi:molybdate transport system substrate-binding protein